MKTRAAVAFEAKKPLEIVELEKELEQLEQKRRELAARIDRRP